MNRDLIITGLTFVLLIQFGISIKSSFETKTIKNELLEAKKAVIELDKRLSMFEDEIVPSLNKEIDLNYQELDEYKYLDKLKKDLATNTIK